MSDPNPPEHSPPWGEVYKRLTLYAFRRLERIGMACPVLAQDLASEAIRRHLDPGYADWDREAYPALLLWLGSVVNGMVRNHMRKQAYQRERLSQHAHHVARDHAPPAALQLESREEMRQLLDILRERIVHDPLLIDVVEAWLEGVDQPAEIALALGCPVQDIYNANRRLRRHAESLRAVFEEITTAR